MTNNQRNKILTQCFTLIQEWSEYEVWNHKNTDIIAILKRKEKGTNEIILFRCKPDEIKIALPFGVKFQYNTPEELITLINSICEKQ